MMDNYITHAKREFAVLGWAKTKDGMQKHLVVSTRGIDFMEKTLFYSTYRDITKQKKMETEFKKTEEELANVE